MKFTIFILAFAIACAVGGLLQHRQISEVRAAIAKEKASLTERRAAEKQGAGAAADPAEVAALRAEKLALMKLRGELPELRKSAALSPEQVQASLAEVETALGKEKEREAELAYQKKRHYFCKGADFAFRQVNYGLRQVTGTGAAFPQSSEEFARRVAALPDYNPYRASLVALTAATNEFAPPHFMEVLPHSGDPNANPLSLRERQARQLPDGTWARYYAFFGGEVKEVILPDDAFDAWEKQQAASK